MSTSRTPFYRCRRCEFHGLVTRAAAMWRGQTSGPPSLCEDCLKILGMKWEHRSRESAPRVNQPISDQREETSTT